MSLELSINDQLKTAMKAKDEVTLRSLRAIKAAILVAKTSEGAGGVLKSEDETKLLQKLVKQRKDSLDIFRQQNREDLAKKDLCVEKVIATVISLMERTYIRVGNAEYEKINGSFGLTTLKDKHVRINGNKIHFAFKGKRGISHNITLQNKRLAKAVKDCRDIPGKELFQYYTQSGERKSIDSSLLNNYIKEITGSDFSAKDFRTWAGSLQMLRSLKVLEKADTPSKRKSNIVTALNEVSVKLGNTRTVCKKYYVHPGIISMYENDEIEDYLGELDGIEEPDDKSDLTKDEKVLMKVLKQLVT